MKYSEDQKRAAYERLKEDLKHRPTCSFWKYKDFEDFKANSVYVEPWIIAKYHEILDRMIKPYHPELGDKNITHPLDIEYFQTYRAPVMELVHSAHYTNINSTIPYFGPTMYFLIRQFGCEQVLEIGVAEGYTSWYMANAVKDNATRFGMAGNMYYGVDIINVQEKVKKNLDAAGLPNTILQMDSIDITRETFKDIKFDFIFQDGCHDRAHIAHEFVTLWPQLKSDGYFVCHDDRGPGEEGCKWIRDMIADKENGLQAEYIRLGGMYGLMIIRKLDGIDPNQRYWND